MNDTIHEPEHYLIGGLEVTRDILHCKLTPEQYEGFLVGSVLSYLFRYQWKGTPMADLYKAQQFLEYLIEEIKSRQGEEVKA